MYVFNELQQEGLGAAMLRHALITSVGWLKFRGQTLLTLQADNIRNVVFAASDESFLESHEDTTPLQSLRTST